ncbi:MAG: hypothetical protein IIB82_13775 [Bacteroidetes bacterium]|nr:hypothetical protein [Bacteroidota bacterium]
MDGLKALVDSLMPFIVSIFPNPVADIVKISVNFPTDYEWGSYDIANLTLQKTSSSNWWNAGASSLGQAGNRYGAEYQIDSRNTDIMFGLSLVTM